MEAAALFTVAALRGVDYVVVFAEPTVDPLLRLLQPDVHCKGTDYTADTVPEQKVTELQGVKVDVDA